MIHDDRSPASEILAKELGSASRSMADFEPGDYLPLLEALDESEDQKAELLGIIWDIMRSFVEMNLPVESCEQILNSITMEPEERAESDND